MAPPREASVSALLASVALFSLAAAAQPGPAPACAAEREIAITGAPDEPPAVLYAAPRTAGDGELRRAAEEGRGGGGAGRRRPPARVPPERADHHALEAPCRSGLGPGAGADGGWRHRPDARLLAGRRRDESVRIVHRAQPRPAAPQGEVEELLSLAAQRTLRPVTCVKRRYNRRTAMVCLRTTLHRRNRRVCGGGALSYVRVQARADCRAAAARLTRARGVRGGAPRAAGHPGVQRRRSCWMVVARAPRGDGRRFTLELLAEGGALCERYTRGPEAVAPPTRS